ncbi:hypothetical protein HZB90_02390, partial [archaeon]|nr:hypothetical protein [archaeon]
KAPYAAIANSDDWFICNTDNRDDSPNLDSTYKPLARNPTGTRREGVLLNEYEILPRPWEQFGEGTTPLPGGPSLGDGFPGSYGGDTGSGGSPHSDSVDEDSFVSDIDETSLRGVGRITACDKDGDGYDGNWSADPIAVSWHDTTEDVCENPQPPFDCDEGNIIDGHYPDETSISRSTFARMRHPGRIDYCIGGVDYDIDCNSATTCIEEEGPTQTSEEFFANPDAFMSYPRFMCSNVDESGDFAECCGWSLGFCFNSQQGRRTGSPIHTLRDFSNFEGGHIISPDEAADRQTMNYVLRYGINLPPESAVGVDEAAYYTLALQSEANELKITDWTHYRTLDFYIWFTTNFEVELWLGKINPVMTPGYPDSYTYPYKLRIVDYVVNEAELNKWLHVSIPIDDITMAGFTPDVMVLASNVLRLIRLGTSVDVTVYDERKTFSNVIGVDKIHFRPKTEQLLDRAKDENYFCTGTWPATWVSDLDQDTPIPGIPDTEHPGRDACEAIPSYGWTGNKCCGDDTGDNTAPGLIGPATTKEFYADTNAGCWAGNVIANGSRIMLVKYNLSYAGIANREVTHSCRNESCVYELPPIKNVLVTNGNPEVYDLYIVNGESKFVGRGALTPDDNSYLRASSVPMQVLFADGKFWSCNAAKFINVSLNTLIPVSNRLTSTGETCSIKAGFFCDHKDGADSGWNGEGLIRYPGTNITLADGTQMDLGTASSVAAEYRGATKRNYNLIRNGGFENV